MNLVTDEVLKELGMDSQDQADEEIVEKKGNLISRAVKTLSDIFVPIVPAIVAGGLLMGINNVLTAQGLFFANKSLIEAIQCGKTLRQSSTYSLMQHSHSFQFSLDLVLLRNLVVTHILVLSWV